MEPDYKNFEVRILFLPLLLLLSGSYRTSYVLIIVWDAVKVQERTHLSDPIHDLYDLYPEYIYTERDESRKEAIQRLS